MVLSLVSLSPLAFLGLPRLTVDTIWAARRAAGLQEAPLQLGRDVEVRTSPGKGRGVFAVRDLPAGRLLSRYTGKIYSEKEFDRLLESGATSGDYALQLADGWYGCWIVDGEVDKADKAA